MTPGTVTAEERAWLRGLGLRVRLGRVARGEAQTEPGARAGVSRVTVGSIERADHPASVVSYARLARALAVPLADLLSGSA